MLSKTWFKASDLSRLDTSEAIVLIFPQYTIFFFQHESHRTVLSSLERQPQHILNFNFLCRRLIIIWLFLAIKCADAISHVRDASSINIVWCIEMFNLCLWCLKTFIKHKSLYLMVSKCWQCSFYCFIQLWLLYFKL